MTGSSEVKLAAVTTSSVCISMLSRFLLLTALDRERVVMSSGVERIAMIQYYSLCSRCGFCSDLFIVRSTIRDINPSKLYLVVWYLNFYLSVSVADI